MNNGTILKKVDSGRSISKKEARFLAQYLRETNKVIDELHEALAVPKPTAEEIINAFEQGYEAGVIDGDRSWSSGRIGVLRAFGNFIG